MPLQLAANARGAIVGLLTLSLLLVLAVAIAGACLKYTRRLLLAGATLLGAGLGAMLTGMWLQRVLPWVGISPTGATGSIARRAEWLWQGDFHVYALAAVLLGLVVVLTESRNVVAVTRNRLVPAGVLAGWGLLNVAASIWLHRAFAGAAMADGSVLLGWSVGLGALGALFVAMGAAIVVNVLRHHGSHKKASELPTVHKHPRRHTA